MIERKHIQEFESLEFLANQTVEGFITGLHKSPYHGFSVEFAEHRVYNTGASTRHIDWKLYARTDKLFVKRYEEETNLRCQIIIDHSSSMYFPKLSDPSFKNPNKIIFSICSAAALMNLLKRQRDAVGLSFFSDKISFHTDAKTTTKHHRLLLHHLESLWGTEINQKSTCTVDALHQIAEKINRRSLVILFSDMIDNSNRSAELFSALQHLKFNKHEVIIFHVQHTSKEIEFDYENKPYRFVDLETGDEIKVVSDQVKREYRKQQKEFIKNLKLKCAQYHIDFIDADIEEGFNPILLSYVY